MGKGWEWIGVGRRLVAEAAAPGWSIGSGQAFGLMFQR